MYENMMTICTHVISIVLFWTQIVTPRFVERGRRKLAMLCHRPHNPEVWIIVIPMFNNVTASILIHFAAFFLMHVMAV